MPRPDVVRLAGLIVLVLLHLGCGVSPDPPPGASPAEADSGESAVGPGPAAPDSTESVQAFFSWFKAAVRANDAAAVAGMAEFPFARAGMSREEFMDQYYGTVLGEGAFRERLLAASPGALKPDDDGIFSYTALVAEDCGDLAEEFDCESAVVFYFGQDEEGRWRLVDLLFAG